MIDRAEIATLKANKLFSDGFALELLFNQIKDIRGSHWNTILNYSNDTVGAYLSSYFKQNADQVTGVHFSEDRNLVIQNDWELVFNEVLSTVKYSPIHFVDCYHRMMNVPFIKGAEQLATNPNHNEAAFANIGHIRKTYGEGANTKVIGIQPVTSEECKNIPFDTLCDFISALNETNEFVPLLLIAPIEKEREYAERINAVFENKLIIVEADLQAIASVLMNVDLLVTPDTVIKHIADLCDTPVLEISLGYAPFLKQGTVNSDNLILTPKITERSFERKSFDVNRIPDESFALRASDIYASILYYFGTRTSPPHLSENVTLYNVERDKLGVNYRAVGGDFDAQIEISRMMSRLTVSQLFDGETEEDLYSYLTHCDAREVTAWIEHEKTNETAVMRDLLGTLRSLLQTQENKKFAKEFVFNLGRLIANCENEFLTAVPTLIFRSKIEALGGNSLSKNIKEIEALIYELKSDIQQILNCIKKLEAQELQAKKNAFVQKKQNASLMPNT